MHVFQAGEIKFQPKITRVPGYFFSSTSTIRNFSNVTSFIPFKLPPKFLNQKSSILEKSTQIDEISNENDYETNLKILEKISM